MHVRIVYGVNFALPSFMTWHASQVRNLNSGTFGFVVLALDKSTGRHVAIKFIGMGVCGGSVRCDGV